VSAIIALTVLLIISWQRNVDRLRSDGYRVKGDGAGLKLPRTGLLLMDNIMTYAIGNML